MAIGTYIRRLQQALKLEGSAWKSGFDDLWRPTGFERPLPVIPFDHIYNHAGRVFMASHIYPDSAKLANNALAEFIIQVGSTNTSHMTYSVNVEGGAELYLYESPTFSSAGNTIAQINTNRTSSNTTDTVISHAPTITVDGSLLKSEFIPGGSGPKASGGLADSFDREIALATDTDYLLRIINISGSASAVSVQFSSIEVESGVEMW